MLVLGIESSCDETAAAIVKDGREILSQCIATQIDLHQIFGGVVPELACRRHIDNIMPVIEKALKQATLTLEEVDLIAVTKGPGLIGALLIGLHAAKGLAFALDKPLVGINHVEAHLYAAIMSANEPISFPCLGLVLSGGHTVLLKVNAIGCYELIGHTVDDAIGEAFDKVAKLLKLPYPGGPEIELLAKKGDANRFAFKAGNVKGFPFHFSFSGLKTAVLHMLKNGHDHAPDIAASFQKTAFTDVFNKTLAASNHFGYQEVLFGGGVVNNRYLKELFLNSSLKCHFPKPELTLDNAAMIAGLGYHIYQKNGPCDILTLEPKTRIPIGLQSI